MPIPALLVAAGAPLVARGVGGLVNRLAGFNKRDKADLVTPAVNAAQQQLADIETGANRRLSDLEQQLARSGATGVTGAAAREGLLRIAAGEGATARGQILDRIASARQLQEETNRLEANQARAAKADAVNAAFAQVGSALSSKFGTPGATAPPRPSIQSAAPSDIVLPEAELDLGEPLALKQSILPPAVLDLPEPLNLPPTELQTVTPAPLMDITPPGLLSGDRFRQRLMSTLQIR